MCADPSRRWLLRCALLTVLLLSPGVSGRGKITLLYGSDMTAIKEELPISQLCNPEEMRAKRCVGGWSRFIGKVKQIRRHDNDSMVLFLDLGNNVFQSVHYLMFGPAVIQKFLHMLKPDVMTVNRRDLYLTPEDQAAYIKAVGAPCVLTNAEIQRDSPVHGLVNRSAVVERDGVRVGVMSFLTRSMYVRTRDDITLIDPYVALNAECHKLNALNLAMVVVVGVCRAFSMPRVAERVACVNVLLSADAYYFLYTGDNPLFKPIDEYPIVVSRKDDQLVVIGGSCTQTYYLCYMSMEMDEGKNVISWSGRPILLDASVPQDEQLHAILNTTQDKVEETFSNKHKVGSTRALIDGRACMHGECSLGNLLADALVAYGWQSNTSHSLMSLVAGAELCRTIDGNRADFGDITKGHLMSCLVYNRGVQTVYIAGREITMIMEYALGLTDTITGENIAFLQVSGLHVTYDPQRPLLKKVIYLEGMVMGKDNVPRYQLLEPAVVYQIIVTDNVVNLLRNKSNLVQRQVEKWNVTQLEALTWYVNHSSPIYPAVEGRIMQDRLESASDRRRPIFVGLPLVTVLLVLVLVHNNSVC